MKFRFKVQGYQTDAVKAVVNVFDGQPRQNPSQYTLDIGVKKKDTQVQGSLFDEEGNVRDIYDDDYDVGFSNAPIKIMESKLLENIKNIQSSSNIRESDSLYVTEGLGACQLDVEMETGTGKTYVYIKTMFEMYRKYGWSKFIVVVPSIAIREGVKKSFEMTQDHFMDAYGEKARYFIYNSTKLNDLETFSSSSKINVMIINIQAFNARGADARRIYERLDEFQSRRPIDVIAKNRPVLIMDEPQKMGGDATQESLKNFNPLFVINYSATHKVHHNLVYVLDALDAYNQKLVKKIEVKGFTVKNLRGTNGYLYLQNILVSPTKPPRALIEIEVSYNKSINREPRYFDVGDDIYETSKHMEQYKNGYTVSEINPVDSSVTFLNGEVLSLGDASGDVSENDIRRIQIRETIISHFAKEEEMFDKGIKVLSLFFIDEVAKYRQYDDEGHEVLGPYGKIFEEEYIKVLNNYLSVLDNPYSNYLREIDPSKTHRGYFSIDKKGRMSDPSTKRNSDESDDVSAYDLILKDKERLLSFEEPTRFIFSHSALREGWDNPNVFQICTLKHSTSDVQRHQEVGRGLRLCVNKDGERMDATVPNIRIHDINKLTVIANESYENFVKGLQSQIQENLFDRPTKASVDYFKGKKITVFDRPDIEEKERVISSEDANAIYFYLVQNGYVDVKGNVTDKYKNDTENDALVDLPGDLVIYSNDVHKLIKRLYDKSVGIGIENGNKTKVANTLNANFQKKEFLELWKCINHKYAYMVDFDTNELIKKSIESINAHLYVTKLVYTVSTGSMSSDVTKEEVDSGTGFKTAKTRSDTIKSSASDSISYDLLGKIRERTQLTRKTVAKILMSINPVQFSLYKVNPEEFIAKVSKLINDEKATIIVEHVSYTETNENPFDSEIFTQAKSKEEVQKAYKSVKNVQDYVFPDSSKERDFAENLDTSEEVVVYAKLPTRFYIPTPVGNYSPDWAIAFKKGDVKHVYFIAETKGTLDSMQLRKVEDAKIECAKKLFETMSSKDIQYGKIDSFSELMNILKS